jgi:hypothetical protein
MGSITDIVALVTQLDASITDRKQRELFLPLKEKLTDLQRELLRVETAAKEEVAKLTAAFAEEKVTLGREIAALEAELVAERKSKAGPVVPAKQCPYCRHASAELLRMEPHRIFGEAGVKIGFYKCSHCGQEHDDEIQRR